MFFEIRFHSDKNGAKKPYGLFRESFRDGKKVGHRTLGQVSGLPLATLEAIRSLLKSGNPGVKERCDTDSREHGAVAAVWEVAKRIGLDKIIFSKKESWREIIVATIVGRLVYQGSKLSLTNIFRDSSLWELAGYDALERPDVDDVYEAMDRLLERQEAIQSKLVARHFENGCVILYDITSSYLEGENCVLADFGHNRDGKKGHRQIVIGLLTTKDGCPVGVEVYRGNTADQSTVMDWVDILKDKYHLENVIFVGDRGMLTTARIKEVVAAGFRTVSALTHRKMASLLKKGVFQLGLFDEQNIVEVADPEQPGVRYMLCRNPIQGEKETETREKLLAKTEEKLTEIASSNRKRTNEEIAALVGKWLNKWKMAKYFSWEINDGKLTWTQKDLQITEDKDLDGCYVICTDVAASEMDKEKVVATYRGLMEVDRDFRQLKTVQLEVRPTYHWREDRVRAHVFLCTLALYIQWHMKRDLDSLWAVNGIGKNRRWSFPEVLLRLKGIRRQTSFICGQKCTTMTEPDAEQANILKLLKVALV
jgi:transposase